MGVLGICAGAATFFLSYFNTQSDKILPSVTIETGTPIVFESFLKEPVESSRFITDVSGIDTNVPGSYQLTVGFWRFRKTVILNVVDTTAPTAEAVPQTIYCDRLPAASSVVTDVYDLTPVTIEYVYEPYLLQKGYLSRMLPVTRRSLMFLSPLSMITRLLLSTERMISRASSA